MYLIRQAQLEDLSTILKLARMVHSNNLPDDPDILRSKIVRSRKSFAGSFENRADREFIFVLEDTETGNTIGCSSIIAAMGGPGHPHIYLQMRKREFYSEDLQTGQVHVTLQLATDESGPSEIGGLILSPAYRGHKAKLGALLSLIRFHYMGLQREWFDDRIIAEMMGPLTPDSRNTLWDYLGRRFINLKYAEADLFCRQSKEFITSLFPKEEIYVSLLPPEARNLIGRVGPESEPAKAMLERLGFQFHGHVDPFDGGPYLEAQLDEIELVQATRTVTLGDPADSYPRYCYLSVNGAAGFRAIQTSYAEQGDRIAIPADAAGLLGAEVGDTLGVTPAPLRRTKRASEIESKGAAKVDVTE